MTEPKRIPLSAHVQSWVDWVAEQVPHPIRAVLEAADDAKVPLEPEVWGNGCECWVTPEHLWTTHYGAVEPGSQLEFNPECPKHGEGQ